MEFSLNKAHFKAWVIHLQSLTRSLSFSFSFFACFLYMRNSDKLEKIVCKYLSFALILSKFN